MTSLAAFSHDWIGGDFWGLEALIGQCDRVASRLTDASRALSHRVSSMTGDGGWTGQAADAFTGAWDKDSKAGTQLADAWTKIGSIAGRLAEELASLESSLEQAADQLEKQGIPVNPATGIPKPDTTMSGNASPSPHSLAARTKLASQYMTYRAKILNQAEQARTHATYALYTVTENLLPQFDWGQLTNDLDGIRSLWALPTQVRTDFEQALGNKSEIDARTWAELLAKHKVSGYNARLEQSTIEDLAKVRAELAEAEANLAGSPPESTISMTAAGDADGLGGLTALKGIPVLGAGAGTVIQIVQDRENHESWAHSIVDGVASNGASLAAGAVVGSGITAGVAMLMGGGSYVGVAAGTLGGAVAAVGIGDGVHHLVQENWGQDWHQRGVLDGTGHGIADSFDKTRHDMAHYGDDILHFFHL